MAQRTMTFLNSVGSSMGITRNNTSRPGPLHTCGVAVISIAQKAYRRVEDLAGPIGSITQRVAPFVCPIFYLIQSHWLASLSFTDNQILAVERVIETVFPPSSHVFDKIDTLVYFSETLPEKFDYAVDKFPVMIRQVPVLNWALAQLILLLSFLISILTDWGFDGAKEKEIMIDMNSHDDHVDTEPSLEPDEDRDQESTAGRSTETEPETEDSTADSNAETIKNESLINSTTDHEVDNIVRDKPFDGADEEEVSKEIMEKKEESGVGKIGGKTYKEVVEMGGKNETKAYKLEVVEMGGNKRENKEEKEEYENGGKIVEESEEKNQNRKKKSMQVSTKDERKADHGCSDEDPFLELFSAGWHMR